MCSRANSKMVEEKEFRPLLRIIDKDIDGNDSIWLALTRVKGVGFMLSNAICKVLNLPKFQKAGYLTDDEIKKIEDCMQDPVKYGVPLWMLNRRKDPESGENKHLIAASIGLQQGLDIRLQKKIKTCRGIRHAKGMRVRGQRSRTTGRKGKTLGVARKKK